MRHRRRQRVALVEAVGLAIDRRHRERRIRADQRLGDVGAVARGEELLLVHEQHERRHEARVLDLQRLFVDLQQQIDLRLERHLEGILLHRRVPLGVGIGLDRREPDGIGVDDLVGLRDADRLPRDRRDVVFGDGAAAGETPGPVDEHADAEAEVLGVDDVLHAAIAREEELVAVAVDADVGVGRAGLLRGGQRGVGEPLELLVGRGEQHRGGPQRRGRPERNHRLHELASIDHGRTS